MTRKIPVLLLLLSFLVGCGSAVKHTISPQFDSIRPYTIAVLPVVWNDAAENEGISRLFRTMSIAKLTAHGYRLVPLEKIDALYAKSGAVASKAPAELARTLGADAVLYTYITEWSEDRLPTFASLKMEARLELHSIFGTRLWKAAFATREFDIRFDTESAELAVIKAYEPRIQRFVDAVFSTLPQAEPHNSGSVFFDWLQ